MRVSTSKPVSSSPARTDKFPPPLMRFLRSNGGSRSRRSSRSSPIFLRKKNNSNSNSNVESQQEPSSPKVTCMGQVRVTRSSNKKAPTPPSRCCSCSCSIPFPIPNWPIFRPKPNNLHSHSHSHSHSSFPPSASPPKNALLFTRCRSAPYRSSSLAARFWASPFPNHHHPPNFALLKLSIRQTIASIPKSQNVHQLRTGREAESDSAIASAPVVLTRCKSEPASTGHRLHPPDANHLWKKDEGYS